MRVALATTSPSMAMLPPLGCSNPAISRSAVVLPQPEAPSRQPICPRGSDNDRARTTAWVP